MKLPLLTHSRMSCAKTCLRKHYYQYELGIRKDRESAPLRTGAAVHEGLDVLAKTKSVDDAVAAAVIGYADIPNWAMQSPELEEEWLVEREMVLRLVMGYAWRWQDAQEEVVASELEFRLPLVNPDTGAAIRSFELGGKIDKIVKLPDGRLAIKEHKTTGDDISAESDYWIRLRIDQQISLYFLAARELGYDVQTVLYDVIRKPAIRPKQILKADYAKWQTTGVYFDEKFAFTGRDRETPQMWGARLRADIGSRPDFYFACREIPRLESDIQDFRYDLWQYAQLLRDSQRLNRWPRSTLACTNPYRCDYLDLCGNGYDASQPVPDGFVKVENIHPELKEIA